MDIEGWTELCLGEILCSKNDKSKQVKSSEYQLIGLYPIIDQSSDFICGYCDDSKKVINNELPYTIFGDHTRHTKFVNFPFVVGADGTQIIKPIQSVDDRFFFYLVSDAANKIGNYGYDRHFKHLREFRCIFPIDKKEQTQIAQVLSTIDRAIAQTEAIIAKQQRIKTGLMQDLLTKGIDENGNIRSEDTHQFKDSAIGRIPVEWELSNLIDVLSLTPKNGIYKPANQIGQGVLLIGQTSFTKDRLLNYELARRASVTSSELQAYQLEEEDILISRVFATVEGVGLPTFVSNLPEASVYESNMLRLRIDNQISLPKLVFYWLNSEQIRKYIIASVNASNQTSINQKTLNALPIPVPPKNEQIKLLKILEKNISCLIEEKASYHKQSILKTGLMQDLLTGKVRVTNLLQEKAAAN